MANFDRVNGPIDTRIFFPEFNIRLYDKNSESDFFFLHQNQNILFSNIENQNIFLEKKTYPPLPFKLNGRSLTRKFTLKNKNNLSNFTSASAKFWLMGI
jgi:hypothetical protein